MPDCPVVLGNPAVGMVSAGYSTFVPLAVGAVASAQQQMQALASFTVEPVQYNVNWDFDGALSSIQRPPRPDDPDDDDFALPTLAPPGEPPVFDESSIRIDEPNDITLSPPSLQFPQAPQPFTGLAPTAPSIAERAAPEEPSYDLPAVPTLEAILLPTPPTITLPPWDIERPDLSTLPEYTHTYGFTPEAYASTLLDRIRAELVRMMDGGTGLPPAIEQAIYDRASVREDQSAARTVQEVTEEFTARGFNEPNGILGARLREVRQANMAQRSAYNRDLAINAINVEIEQHRFALTAGNQLEQTLIGLHFQTQDLILRGQQFLLDASVRVFETRASLVRLRVDVFRAEAEVFESRVRAEIAKAEVYRAEIEGARVRGEINEQLVRRYEAQLRAIGTLADFYNSRVTAFRALLESDGVRMERFRVETQGFAERVRAKESEFSAYRAGVEAQGVRAGVYTSQVQAAVAAIGAKNDTNRVRLDLQRVRFGAHEAQLRTYDARLGSFRAQLEAGIAQIRANTERFQAQAQIYTADGNVEQAVSAARDRSFQLKLANEDARVNAALKEAEIRKQEGVQLAGLILEQLRSLATVSAQLAAGLTSAVNFGASVSSSVGESQSCSTSYNYSGELATS